MPDGRVISTGFVRLGLTSNGSAVDGTVKVLSVSTLRMLDRVPRAQITIQDGDPATQDFPVSASETFAPGAKIEVLTGYGDGDAKVFSGIVTRQRLTAGRGGDTLLVIELKDPVVASTVARVSRVSVDSTDADAIRAALEAPGVTVEMEDGETQAQIVQAQATGWDFALARARAMGLVIDCDGGTISIRRLDLSQAPSATLEFGQGIFRFDIELDAEAPLAEAVVTGWSPADQETVSAEATDPSTAVDGLADVLGGRDAVHDAGGRSAAALDMQVGARLTRHAQAGLRGTVEVQGRADIAPGAVVSLKGFGRRFETQVLVGGVRHEIGRGDWLTTLELGLPLPSAAATPQAAAIPPIAGLQLATVEGLTDGEGEDAITVTLHVAPDTPLRARLATLEAGDGRGLVMRPSIGDEVVVGFLGDDPRDPVVLGALHSSAHPAPVPGDDENAVKAYVSQKESRLEFNDARPAITLSTAGGASLVLDDDAGKVILTDQNGNEIELSASGISIAAGKALKLDAGTDLEGKAGTNLGMEAGGQAAVSGSAGASFESSAICVVKGALVQIN
ncbi:hypothetical protein DKT77_19115 [Meridianimarinicoccus roseus]|uniref:Gp5/Type VI secretion system Vgr protein OB-fold domain-containing protein n=1 Tax=Meridianimarinicoccus roseus TaxID=2072018 RepID=A0A2V2LGK4_9RHOB|nr:phage baseplate assembly protein V [Meridianimarinicoccus roseus]PWR01043.1 hypothetical protein DKT77_19115 [Meridianimarinicoccus roseus]